MARFIKQEAVERLTKVKGVIPSLRHSPGHTAQFMKWYRDTRVAIEYIFGAESKHLKEFRAINYTSSAFRAIFASKKAFLDGLDQAEALLQSMIEEIEDWFDLDEISRQLVPQSRSDGGESPDPLCVFIGHGGDDLWMRVKLFLEETLRLTTVTYESELPVGESVVPFLEKMLTRADFAILVLTGEDETTHGTKRARQNVIHEAGLFQGKLGFKRTVMLIQEGVESFTNVAGLQYIAFAGNQVEHAFHHLLPVLIREGLVRLVPVV
jgi:hypothetical protein